MNKNEIIDKIQSIMPEIKSDYGIKSIALCGSYAKENQKQDSDIDILVDFVSPPGLVKFYVLNDLLENVFQKKVDLITINSVHKSIKEEILAEAIFI